MLFHRDIKWDDTFDSQAGGLVKGNILFSNHVWEHIDNPDDKHAIDFDKLCEIVESVKRNKVKPFEVETDNSLNVEKAVVRRSYDRRQDISLVFRKGLLVTAWLNGKEDKHATLDASKYVS